MHSATLPDIPSLPTPHQVLERQAAAVNAALPAVGERVRVPVGPIPVDGSPETFEGAVVTAVQPMRFVEPRLAAGLPRFDEGFGEWDYAKVWFTTDRGTLGVLYAAFVEREASATTDSEREAA